MQQPITQARSSMVRFTVRVGRLGALAAWAAATGAGLLCAVRWSLPPAASQDAGHPQLVLQFGHSDPVRAIAFSPDGKTLASGSEDYTIKLWDAQTGELK